MFQAILLICAIFCFALDAMAVPTRVRLLPVGLIFLAFFLMIGVNLSALR